MATPIPSRSAPAAYGARARWATVTVETDRDVYVGRLYIPDGKRRLSDVLCDDRPFLNLTEVSVGSSEHPEPYVAINKQVVRTVRILDEGIPEIVPVEKR